MKSHEKSLKGLQVISPEGLTQRKKLQKTHEEKKMITFSQFFCFFTESYININHKQSTISRDKYRIKLHIIPFFGAMSLNKITVKDILKFKDSLQHVPGTFNKCYTLLHKAFSLAEGDIGKTLILAAAFRNILKEKWNDF